MKLEKSQANWVLWLGILGVWPLFFLAPVAWVLGNRELSAVDAGRVPADKRSRTRIGRRLGVLGTMLWAAVLAFVVGTALLSDPGPLIEEDFSSGTSFFSTDSDRFIDLLVEDGEYQVRIKDPQTPHHVRTLFDRTFDGIRFEASLRQATTEAQTLASVGCWAGDSAYLFVLFSTGEVFLLETVSERTAERLPLTDLTRTDALLPVGSTNRLRIDCVGGGTGDSTVTGWVNGVAIVAVALENGLDSFNGAGFWFAANDPTNFSIDDVTVRAERPDPAIEPVPPVDPSTVGVDSSG